MKTQDNSHEDSRKRLARILVPQTTGQATCGTSIEVCGSKASEKQVESELRIRTFSQTSFYYSDGSKGEWLKSAVLKAKQIEHSKTTTSTTTPTTTTCTQVYTGYYISNKSTALKIFILYLNQRESFDEKENLLQRLFSLFFSFFSFLFYVF